jgi:subfamily B ATP-binding cassette protein MsbA
MDRALIRRLLGYLRPYVWPYFAGAMACMILFGATAGAMPFLVRFIFDDIFTEKNSAVLQVLPFAIIGVFIFRGLCGFGSGYLSEYVSNQIINDLRNDLNGHIQDLSLGSSTAIRPAPCCRASPATSTSSATRSPVRRRRC